MYVCRALPQDNKDIDIDQKPKGYQLYIVNLDHYMFAYFIFC